MDFDVPDDWKVDKNFRYIINYYRQIYKNLIGAELKLDHLSSTLKISYLYDTNYSCPNNHGLSCRILVVFGCLLTDDRTNQETEIMVPLELETG